MPVWLAAAARLAGDALLKSLSARAGAKAAEAAAGKAAESAAKAPKMNKVEKATDAFNRLFRDHPANQPPPLPDRRSWWAKAGGQMLEDAKGFGDKWKADPIGQATNSMTGYARQVESGKSIGQGVIDSLKRIDPTGLVGLASAGMEANLAVATRGVKAGQKVVQDDFIGLLGEVAPDAAMKFIRALGDLTDAVTERGRYLSKYNADLATSSAMADVRKIRSELREAQTVGKSYSRVIDQQSILENKLRDAFAPVKEAIADRLAAILELLNRLIDASFIKEALAVFSEVQRVITAFFSFDPDTVIEALAEMPERIATAILGGGDEDVDLNDVIRQGLADLKRGPQGPQADPKARMGGAQFNFPLVRGA